MPTGEHWQLWLRRAATQLEDGPPFQAASGSATEPLVQGTKGTLLPILGQVWGRQRTMRNRGCHV